MARRTDRRGGRRRSFGRRGGGGGRDGRSRYLPSRGSDRRSRGGGVLVIVLVLIVVAVVVFFLFRGGSNSTNEAGSATGSTTQGTGAVRVETGENLLDVVARGGALSAFENRPETGDGVEVQSVVSDEGFWVGPSEQQRIFVVYVAGASPVDINAGSTVSFTGALQPLPIDFDQRFGLTTSEGSEPLRTQGYFVQATTVHSP
jgi:hypothetical protein